MPALCVLDPDGDMVRHLRATDQGRLDPDWACYHSELYRFERDGHEVGIIGCAVGAPYAVLVAEMDACNVRWGRGSVVPGTAGLASSRKDWSTKFEMRSPRYTTQLAELATAYA